jgi:hypothetical protein
MAAGPAPAARALPPAAIALAVPPRAAQPRPQLPAAEREAAPTQPSLSPPVLPLAAAPAAAAPQSDRPPPLPAAAGPMPVPDSLPAVTTETFGPVRIGLEGDVADLRVSLAVSAGAPALLAVDAPRLAADLAANGIRLQSLDVGSFAGGAGGSLAGGGGQQRPAGQQAATLPTGSFAAPPSPSRAAAADRYA